MRECTGRHGFCIIIHRQDGVYQWRSLMKCWKWKNKSIKILFVFLSAWFWHGFRERERETGLYTLLRMGCRAQGLKHKSTNILFLFVSNVHVLFFSWQANILSAMGKWFYFIIFLFLWITPVLLYVILNHVFVVTSVYQWVAHCCFLINLHCHQMLVCV